MTLIAPPQNNALDHKTREPNPRGIVDPSSAQFQLWLAEMKRDHGDLSGAELTKLEGALQPLARRSITMYNPFTKEIRKVSV